MLHELLVIAEGPDRGRIVHAQPAPAQWGAKEGPPRFAVVTVDVPAGVDPLSCTWDFGAERLVVPAAYRPIDTCHLLYHLYPWRGSDVWRRNAAQLRRRLHAFNGRKLVAVARDGQTATLEEVRTELPGCELVPVDNDPRIGSDAQGLARLLPLVRSTASNEAIFFAHGKGVSHHGDARRSEGITYWRNALYAALLDHPAAVRDALRTHPCVGGCKVIHGPDHRWPTGLRWGTWHYAGTFWWARCDALFGDPRWTFVAADRFGGEAYLGGLFGPEQGASLYQPIPVDRDGGWHYLPETHTLRIPDDDGPGTRVSVVITCKGRLHHLRLALHLWQRQEVSPREVIVVDYGCPNGTSAHLAQHFPWVRCVRVTRDTDEWNISRARNIGICQAAGDRILLADADLLVGPDYVARIEEQFGRGAELILTVSPTCDESEVVTYPYYSGQSAFTLGLFRQLRGFDEQFRGWGYDDIDFYERARRTGATVRDLYGHTILAHDDARRMAYCTDRDIRESAKRNRQRMEDLSRPINPEGYGRL